LEDLYPDALDCLARVRAAGMLVGLAGNQDERLERWARSAGLPVDVVTGSASLGVRKPEPAFFDALVELAGREPAEVAYVGDRADNDAAPALAAGLVAVHLRRGPWGRLQTTPSGAIAVDSLAEVPDVLATH
jgi:HAD superfamily hydrolase (TIGR01549 family)